MRWLIFCDPSGEARVVPFVESVELPTLLEYHGIAHKKPFDNVPSREKPAYWIEHYLVIEGSIFIPESS